jgi:hypothetical protein
MRDEIRLQLQREQSALIRALIQSGGVPPEFDVERIEIASQALFHKRRRSVARSWPALTAALGDQFSELFGRYAALHPPPRDEKSLADGREFARFLAQHGNLPDAGRIEAAAVDVRYARGADGLSRRRGPSAVVRYLHEARELAIGIRVPFWGERWFRVPWGR